MNNRIKEIRKTLNLTMDKFGARVGVNKSAISRIEKGINGVTEQMFKLICSEFNVNEEWLRTGKGQMFNETKSDFLDILASEYNLDALDKKIINAYLTLDPLSKSAIKAYINNILSDLNIDNIYNIDIDSEIADYRAELEAEQLGNQKLSVSENIRDA